jgi:hypothetical protein
MTRFKLPTKEQIAQVEELSKSLDQVELMKAMNLERTQFYIFRKSSPAFKAACVRGFDYRQRLRKLPTKEQIAQVEELSKTLTQVELMKAMKLGPTRFNNIRIVSSKFDEAYLRGSGSNPQVRFKPKPIVDRDVLFEEEIMKLAMLVVEMPVEEAIEKTIGLSKEKYNKARKNQPHLVYTIDVANAYRLAKAS